MGCQTKPKKEPLKFKVPEKKQLIKENGKDFGKIISVKNRL